jgi:hypothetical protein
MEFESISKLERLLSTKCKIEKVYPGVFASDAETNIVTVEVKCPDGQIHKIRAYGDEAHALREFMRNSGL